jgi:NAD(P)-dependent dehydrogenase (short-subunit alcohol dehydrogenase family)
METQKIALVTGGSRGLGKNIALAIAKKGIDVILTYQNNQAAADEVVMEIKTLGRKAIAIPFDVAQVKSFDVFVMHLKMVLTDNWNRTDFDFLINNAGIGIHVPFAETTEDQFDQLNNIQFKGVYFLTQKTLSIIANGGSIINIATGLTRFALPGFSAYASMKGAIEVFTKYLAKELGARQISANVIAPGAIETDFGGGVVRDNEQMNAIIATNTALGRVGLPDDIGGVVAFLCTAEAKWINAQRIEVSGGQMI